MTKSGLRFFPVSLATAFLISATARLYANDATVYWDFYTGFVPTSVIVKQGETVHINNIDMDDLSVVVHSTGSAFDPEYFQIEVPANSSGTHTYNSAGTFSFISEYGDTVNVTVNAVEGYPAPLWLTNPRVVSRQFQLDVSGLTIGQTNILQVSTNLVDWTDVQTNVANTASTTLSDPVSGRTGLYRVVQLP